MSPGLGNLILAGRIIASVRTAIGLVVLAVAGLGCVRNAVEQPQPLSTVPGARLGRLARTVNVVRWSGMVREPVWMRARRTLSDSDIAAIRGLGFTAVRLAVPVGHLFQIDAPNRLDPTTLAEFDDVLNRLLAHDLAVIVDLHATGRRIETDSIYAQAFVRSWARLAEHLSRSDPERVFLEARNEPVYEGRTGDWPPLQRRLLATMRREAPRHTLIATGPLWSSIGGLLEITPVADPNVIYTFHFYEPMAFTHQGEGGPSSPEARLRGVPYPVDRAACARAAAMQRDSSSAAAVREYCAQAWDAALVEQRLERAADWGRAHGVPVFLGEFGVSRRVAPPRARTAWIRDVRVAAERLAIGWAIWSFDGRFGLAAVRAPEGGLMLDAGVVAALGLHADSLALSGAR